MPYLGGGTLWSWTQETKPSYPQKLRVLLQILQGLEHLRQELVIHCDITPTNIFMSSLSADAEPRIANFDLSKDQQILERDSLADFVTPPPFPASWYYLAPEVVEHMSQGSRGFSHKSDMYSFGVTMVEFLTERLVEPLRNQSLESLTFALHQEVRDLATKVLEHDPGKRCSSAEALIHKCFTSSLVQEREQLDRQRVAMAERHDRMIAEHLCRQDELAQNEQDLRLIEAKLMAEQKALTADAKLLARNADIKAQQLQKEKKELSMRQEALREQQVNLNDQLQKFTSEWEELEKEQQKLDAEKLRIERDRVLVPPSYWQGRGKKGSRQIDVTQDWKDAMQELMNSTCKVEYIGRGRDNRSLNHTRYRVQRVFRVENHDLWSMYALKRRAVGFSGRAGGRGSHHPHTKVSSWQLWMRDELFRHNVSNEVFLFHGTSPDKVDVIAEFGFDERVGLVNGLFGAGIYMAENASKSDEYCTPDRQGLCYMFLVRAVLGTPFEALQQLKMARRPPSIPGQNNRLYDSVIGVTSKSHPGAFLQKYREFVVYDGYQVYPEFIIVFKRV
eukprot:768599-Hanusia_phi.AAC.2